ncbi:MAG: hypothetical protein J6K55_09985 [Clostridia bacterium]|nr:hypothetical protein [Clostridia bacterium]
MKRLLLLTLMLLLGVLPAAAEDAPSARVWLDGAEVATVYQTAVSHQRFWSENPELTSTPVAIATHAFPCNVEIDFGCDVQSAVVRPLADGIVPEIRDGKVIFAMQEPANLTVEINGTIDGALHLFVDEVDEKPDPEAKNVIYYGPGVYRDVLITPKSNQLIYLDEGALIYGQIFCGMGNNFTIAGHGVLCGSIYDRWEDQLVPVSLTNCSDFTVRDITILDPSAWTFNLLRCKNVLIDNVKIISARSNGDGFTFQNCENVTVQNSFVRSWDDSMVVKGYNGNVSNITFENMTIWTDLAQSCEVGYETRAKVMKDITFRDITVLHNFHKPVISIHNSDNAKVLNVLFENIVVEDAQMGEGDGTPYLIDFTTTESQWSVTPTRGTIDGVTVRNVTVLDGKKPSIRIWSNDESSRIDNVSIEGLTILGEVITNFDQIVFEASPFNGENISICE